MKRDFPGLSNPAICWCSEKNSAADLDETDSLLVDFFFDISSVKVLFLEIRRGGWKGGLILKITVDRLYGNVLSVNLLSYNITQC